MQELKKSTCGCLLNSKGEVVHPCSNHILENPCVLCPSRLDCNYECQSKKVYEEQKK